MKTLLLVLSLLASSYGQVASYGLNASSGTVATDSSGSNTGTLTNGPTWVVGKYGNGVKFDGVNDYISIPDANALDIGNTGTIEAWVKLATINRWNGVIAKGSANADSAQNYALETNNLNKWQCALGSGTAARTLLSIASAAANTWYHVACVWDGTNLKLHINGVQNASVAQNLTPAANTSTLQIGRFGGAADYMAGVIDEVRIYNRALSTAEVVTDMNTAVGSPPPPPPPQKVVDLTWVASTSSGVTNYKVYRATTTGGPYSLQATTGNVLAWTDSTVVAATTYYYVVTAVTGSESAYSNEAQAVIP